MSLFFSLLAACALVASVFTGSPGVEKTDEICVTPNNERGAGCNRITLMYFYNKTSGRCQNFRWTGCDGTGVFDTLHTCVSTCNKEQGAPFCADPPPSPCEEPESKKARQRYYYNITTQTCEAYSFCGQGQRLLDNNYFTLKGYCLKQCGGFDEGTAKGRNESKVLE